MADLSTLDTTAPTATDPVSEGDDRIRETRVAVVTSFDIEHSLAGPHTFFNGDDGSRPSIGNAGRIFLNTTKEFLEYDTGSVWQQLHAIHPELLALSASGALTVSGTFVSVGSVVINTRANSKVLVAVLGEWQWVSGTAPVGTMRVTFDGSSAFSSGVLGVSLSSETIVDQSIGFFTPGPTAFSTLTAGSHTVAISSAMTGSGHIRMVGGQALVLVM